ncbi:MAG TPA: tetratricopeptide repeat protein [Vicinamibacterales bacterium]|nr:tetratricopeptide repeat protein [Vicinamibacterales bacterium]
MTADPRILELRRRVQADPASLAFAQLAEELRRSGDNDEAVATCRAGLVHHPDNLTARVTLGRALIELDRLDEAFTELTFVLDAAPGNLPAIRALAEIYQRRGMMSEALVHYRRALQLAQHDTDLEHTVVRIQQVVEPPPRPPAPSPARIEELFDFDALLKQLDAGRSGAAEPSFVPLKKPPQSALDSVVLKSSDEDAFAVMEQQLREREEQRLLEERQARQAEAERKRILVLRELEDWLAAIVHDRGSSASI